MIVPHATVVSRESDASARQERLDLVEHRREYGEDDELMVGCLALEDLHEVPDLGRWEDLLLARPAVDVDVVVGVGPTIADLGCLALLRGRFGP